MTAPVAPNGGPDAPAGEPIFEGRAILLISRLRTASARVVVTASELRIEPSSPSPLSGAVLAAVLRAKHRRFRRAEALPLPSIVRLRREKRGVDLNVAVVELADREVRLLDAFTKLAPPLRGLIGDDRVVDDLLVPGAARTPRRPGP